MSHLNNAIKVRLFGGLLYTVQESRTRQIVSAQCIKQNHLDCVFFAGVPEKTMICR